MKNIFVFLDIDGVLNHTGITWEGPWTLCPECIHNLNEFLDALNTKEKRAHVILSSTWRHYHTPQEATALLQVHGFKHEIVGRTPHLGTCERGREIAKFITDNKTLPTPDAVIIFDDEDDMFEYLPSLVQTEYGKGDGKEDLTKLGLTMKHVMHALRKIDIQLARQEG